MGLVIATRSAFISFDYDHDNDLRGNLVLDLLRLFLSFAISSRLIRCDNSRAR
jgi:hypothetical protein